MFNYKIIPHVLDFALPNFKKYFHRTSEVNLKATIIEDVDGFRSKEDLGQLTQLIGSCVIHSKNYPNINSQHVRDFMDKCLENVDKIPFNTLTNVRTFYKNHFSFI